MEEIMHQMIFRCFQNPKIWMVKIVENPEYAPVACIWMFPKIGVKTLKWMVKIMENPMNKWMIWGENTPIFGNIHKFSFSDPASRSHQDLTSNVMVPSWIQRCP